MRNFLTAAVLLAATAACNGGSHPSPASTGNQVASTGGSSTGAASAGGPEGSSTGVGTGTAGASTNGASAATSGTTGTTSSGTSAETTGASSTGGSSTGSTTGALPPGAACSANAACASGLCGVTGSGSCCAATCATSDPLCGASGCDDTGACVYPAIDCGASFCQGSTNTQLQCDGAGTCSPVPSDCPGSFACDTDAGTCLSVCAVLAECASGSFCVLDAGSCASQIATGSCTENDACTSGICGTDGSGSCCANSCASGDPTCGASGCDSDTGACEYPDAGLACGSAPQSCTAGFRQDPSACDGQGDCAAPAPVSCSPYACGGVACLAICSDDTSCGTGSFCDVAGASCCKLALGATLAVDSVNGSDATACCGTGSNGPCQTLARAMQIIDAARAQKVTLNATVADAGGDWAPAGEVYPIVLGWGVELNAPGVYFYDPASPGNAEIFDVAPVSANDTIGYASIVGTGQTSQIWIGLDSAGDQSLDASAIQVEANQILYIANATVNGSAAAQTTALRLVGSATMAIGTNVSSLVTGTVNIGAAVLTDGWTGIACVSAGGQGCQIVDSLIGASSLVMQGQENVDIDAEDYANITLASSPIIGVAPTGGFGTCPSKNDALSSGSAAVLVHGQAIVNFTNATVQCISGSGFELLADGPLVPSLTLAGTTVQNTEYGLYAEAGTATLTGSTIQFNYHGVQQDTDGTRTATIDLSGGSSGTTNSVVCSSNTESIYAGGAALAPGVSVLNTTASDLNASNTDWDTAGPDLFTCDDSTLATCTCPSGNCSLAAGADGMDAVEASSGTVTTTGNGLSTIVCGG